MCENLNFVSRQVKTKNENNYGKYLKHKCMAGFTHLAMT
jgi:hypothetical protein